MSATPAFKWYLGGFSQPYVQETIHLDTIANNLENLSSEVRAAIMKKFTEHYESVQAMSWLGPWVNIQCDATSTNNTEYFTVSFSWSGLLHKGFSWPTHRG